MIGSGNFSGIVGRSLPGVRLVLQRSHGAFEVEDLPERDAEIQKPDTTHRTAHPAGSNDCLQTLNTSLVRSIQQKVIVAPIANSPHAVRPPWRHGEKDANLEAQDDIKNNA